MHFSNNMWQKILLLNLRLSKVALEDNSRIFTVHWFPRIRSCCEPHCKICKKVYYTLRCQVVLEVMCFDSIFVISDLKLILLQNNLILQ